MYTYFRHIGYLRHRPSHRHRKSTVIKTHISRTNVLILLRTPNTNLRPLQPTLHRPRFLSWYLRHRPSHRHRKSTVLKTHISRTNVLILLRTPNTKIQIYGPCNPRFSIKHMNYRCWWPGAYRNGCKRGVGFLWSLYMKDTTHELTVLVTHELSMLMAWSL